jgi:hypothetical protein
MCASCGCGSPNENHGDTANITNNDIEKAAKAADITPAQVIDNLRASI